jgi:cysteine sulfinate desulfinase/cysteine desulfurase-like protein
LFFAHRDMGNHIITTRIEHTVIVEPCQFLDRLGAQVLPVDGTGRIDLDALRGAITPLRCAWTCRGYGSRSPSERTARTSCKVKR